MIEHVSNAANPGPCPATEVGSLPASAQQDLDLYLQGRALLSACIYYLGAQALR